MQEKAKPYGYVLVLRGLARAAIQLGDRPATLRVLCVLADYFAQDGTCRFGQGTVAARLGMSRQAVNKHLRILDQAEILTPFLGKFENLHTTEGATKTGRTLMYVLNLEGLEDQRAGEDKIQKYRQRKQRLKSGAVPISKREGYPAYVAAMTENDIAAVNTTHAILAMERHEAQMGIRYEVAEQPSVENGFVRLFRKVSIPSDLQP